jgi:hypothetical protein
MISPRRSSIESGAQCPLDAHQLLPPMTHF